MSPATPALLTNLAIIVGAVLTVWITSNPLALFVLMLLKDVPFVIQQPYSADQADDDEEGGQPMGFIH